jgi:hypothetical protein
MAATGCDDSALVLESNSSLSWYEPAAGVFYGFCGVCGSTLFWRADATPDWISIAAGSLDLPTRLTTEAAWWTSTAADYHALDQTITSFETEPNAGSTGS